MLGPAHASQNHSSSDKDADDVDVLVAGSGVAGLAAALESAREGARVLVIEAFSTIGGASHISGAASFVVGSPLQEAASVDARQRRVSAHRLGPLGWS